MRLPVTGGGPRLLLEAINKRRGMTFAEMCESPSSYGVTYPNGIRKMVATLQDRGWIELRDDKYFASADATQQLADLTPIVKIKPAVVPSREVNRFTRPIQSKHIPSAVGTRPEAAAWRNIPSKGGD